MSSFITFILTLRLKQISSPCRIFFVRSGFITLIGSALSIGYRMPTFLVEAADTRKARISMGEVK